MRRIASSIILALLFLSLFAFAFTLQTARAQGYIWILANGSIASSGQPANITTSDNITYTFTGNNYLPMMVDRSNIIINGMGHKLQAPGGYGFTLQTMSNVTIKNTIITNSAFGIYLYSSSGNALLDNHITTNSSFAIQLYGSSGNTLSGNTVTTTGGDGIELYASSDNNTLSGNNVTANGDVGIDLESSSNSNTLSGNNVTANNVGVYLDLSSGNVLSGNNVTANSLGVDLGSSSGNVLFGNNVTANSYYGIYLYSSSDNTFYHNNFINAQQVYSDSSSNTWDNGYPSGGNYWSDYRTRYPNAVENDSSAIWNTPYNVSSGNIDRYPLMGPFDTFGVGTWNGTAYSVDTVSNSTITNVSFDPATKTLSFNVTGANGTAGFCRISIPLSLMSGEWTVTVNGTQLSAPNLNITTYGNYAYIYFTYHHSTETVKIQSTSAIPEFPSLLILPLFMIATLLAVVIYKKRKIVLGCSSGYIHLFQLVQARYSWNPHLLFIP